MAVVKDFGSFRETLAVFLLLGFGATTAVAESSDDWRFRIAHYAWATVITGTTGVREVEAEVDLSIGDVFDDLQGALMLTLEARKDR